MDLLMKRLLPTCFLPLAVTFTLHAGAPVIFEKPDTVTVHSTGRYNRVVIDSIQLNDSLAEPFLFPVKGEIIQTGENNRVEINTGGEAPNNKLQKTNNHQITDNKLSSAKSRKAGTQNLPEQCPMTNDTTSDSPSDQCPMTNDKDSVSSGQHIKISQTGKNNSVKINSR